MSSFLDLSKPLEVIRFTTMTFETAKVTAVGMNTTSDKDGDNEATELWFSVEFEDGSTRKLQDAFGVFKDEWRYVS